MKSLLHLLIYPFCLGALYSLSFAPFNAFYIGWPALACFYLYFQKTSTPFKSAFMFALGYQVAAHHWIYHSIATYGELNLFLSTLLTAGTLIYLSLVQGILLSLFHHPKLTRLKQNLPTLFFATVWISFEWLKTTPVIYFPWTQFAHSVSATPLNGLLPLFGILGTGFILIYGLCFCAHHIKTQHYSRVLLFIILICVSSFYTKQIRWGHTTHKPLSFAAIQGNITEFEKWDINNLSRILQIYSTLSTQMAYRDLIIWPEGAVPLPWSEVQPLLQPLITQLQNENTTLILGAPEHAQGELLYNSLIATTAETQIYRKQNLVYFGETLPFRKLLMPVIDWLQAPPPVYTYHSDQPQPIHVKNIWIAPSICFDIAFHNTLKQFFPRSNFILTISDDAWFGDSIALAQHLQIASTQSLIFARPQIVATNSGITALLDATGHIQQRIPAFTQSLLDAQIQGVSGTTPASQFSDEMVILCAWLICLFAYFLIRQCLLKR